MTGRAVIYAIANQKGGVAKTTTVASLGAALAELGRRVLLVDLDPQACLTFSAGVDPEDVERSLHHVLLRECRADAVLFETVESVDLLPATIDLATAETTLATRPGREQVLQAALAPLAEDYDVVLLDCPPTLGLLTVVALTAADHVLVPLQCETLSHRGVGQLLDTVHDVRQLTNPRLHVAGVLPTLYDGRSRHARTVLDQIGPAYGVEVWLPPVPRSIRFAEAPAGGRSVLATAGRTKGAAAYREHAARIAQAG